MRADSLLDELKQRYGLTSDLQLSRLLGVTSPRVSQLRASKTDLTTRQVCAFLKGASDYELQNAIRPAVEMYPINRCSSKQDAKWELLPTSKTEKRNLAIKRCLESIKGIYIFYDSQGCAIYAGRTVKQNIWMEMTSAFNRERSNHQAFLVPHPETGSTFKPAWYKPRPPTKRIVYLCDTANYFSAFQVSPALISNLEAFVVRSFCNSLSNKKMERFQSTSA